MVDAVLDLVTAGFTDAECASGVVGAQEVDLGSDLAVHLEEDELVALGATNPDEEGLVVLLVDKDVAPRVGAEAMAVQTPGAHGVVDGRVEDVLLVVAPRQAVVGALDGVAEILARREIAKADGVDLVAFVVR